MKSKDDSGCLGPKGGDIGSFDNLSDLEWLLA